MQSIGEGWVGMLVIDCVWAARAWLPLPTFFYWPEAVHLGDLLRLWVQPEARVYTRPPDFQGPATATPDADPDAALRGRGAYFRSSRFQAIPPLTKKRQLFPGLQPASPGPKLCSSDRLGAARSAFRFGNIDPIPFWCIILVLGTNKFRILYIINLIDSGYFKHTYI